MEKINLNPNWKFKETFPTISAYTTVSNCVSGNYPFIEAIKSFAWCDEVVVVDNFSNDGTWEKLLELKNEISQLVLYQINMEDCPNKDGLFKGMARAMCTAEYLIQFDSDEICKGSIGKWKKIVKTWNENDKLLSLPILEPIGFENNIRVNESHTPWKWRISRSSDVEVTHGLSKSNQKIINGVKYSKGSDGCEYIHIVSEEMIPHRLNNNAKKMLELKNSKQFDDYKNFIENIIKNDEPYILHVGHINLKNKIKLYLKTWHSWWNNLYGKEDSDPQNNIYFPGVKYENVTEEMIENKIKEIIETTPSVTING